MPPTSLIINQTEFFNKIMNKILPSSGNLYLLVGVDIESDIAVPQEADTFEQDVVKKLQIDNEEQFRLFWLYIRLLGELFITNQEARIKYPSKVSNQYYFNFKYQTDAIDSALSINDRLVYQLYNLTEEEIAFYKTKQEKIINESLRNQPKPFYGSKRHPIYHSRIPEKLRLENCRMQTVIG